MSKEIYKINSSIIIKGNENPPRSGSFEVTINGKLIYSKFRSKTFPNIEQIKNWVQKD